MANTHRSADASGRSSLPQLPGKMVSPEMSSPAPSPNFLPVTCPSTNKTMLPGECPGVCVVFIVTNPSEPIWMTPRVPPISVNRVRPTPVSLIVKK